MKRFLMTLSVLALGLGLAYSTLRAGASANVQLPTFSTPTPRADGSIVYIVQEGDSCIRISLLTGVTVEQIRILNRLDESCNLRTGQELILGVGGPSGATPTPGLAPTVAAATPTPTPLPGAATVCILLYEDLNGNSIREDTEIAIVGGAVSLSGGATQFSKSADVAVGLEPVCFEEVPEGGYSVSAAAPQGYNPTTQQDTLLDIKAGEEVYVSFGAQRSGDVQAAPTADPQDSTGLIGTLGLIFLLGGLGLGAYYLLVYRRSPTKFK